MHNITFAKDRPDGGGELMLVEGLGSSASGGSTPALENDDEAGGNSSSEEKSGLGGPSIWRRYARSRRLSSRSWRARTRARRYNSSVRFKIFHNHYLFYDFYRMITFLAVQTSLRNNFSTNLGLAFSTNM